MTTAPRVSEIVADRYEVLSVLGRGGMGIVYAARNRVTGREVAIKWLSDERAQTTEGLQRLLREAQVAGRVHHPNVVDVYDVCEHAGSLFLVMERLHGRPLSELLEAGPVAPDALLASVLPAMRGVAAAHRQGVIHRDLKPSNIFLCCDDAGDPLGAKVLDFGVAKVRSSLELSGETLTRSGAVMGTPQYMAPELFDDARTIDTRADIYALGVILYRALSGELPFKAESFAQLVHKLTSAEPRPLTELVPELDPALVAVVMRALEKNPDARFAEVSELVRALEPFAGSSALVVPQPKRKSDPDVGGTPLATETRLRTRARHPSMALAFALGAGLAGTVFAAYAALHSGSAAREHAPAPAAASAASVETVPIDTIDRNEPLPARNEPPPALGAAQPNVASVPPPAAAEPSAAPAAATLHKKRATHRASSARGSDAPVSGGATPGASARKSNTGMPTLAPEEF